jgi:hypothetical protein
MLTPQLPGIQLMAAKAREQQSDLWRGMERGRLVRKVGSTRHDFSDRVLTSIGNMLISAGEKLRERHVPVMLQGSEAYQSHS